MSSAHKDELPLLFAVSEEADREGTTIGVAALDVNAALDVIEHEKSLDAVALERAIYERAVIATKTPQTIKVNELGAFFERILKGELKVALARASLDTALARVVLELPRDQLLVSLDGRPLATASSRSIALEDVPPGARAIRVDDPREELEPFETKLELAPAGEQRVTVKMSETPRDAWSPIIYGVAVAGAIAGGSLMIYGAAAAPGGSVSSACPTGASCPEDRHPFASFCELGSDRPSSCGEGGLAPVPLGLGLTMFGAGSAGTLFVLAPDSSLRAWLPWAAGIALGAASFAASTALGR